MRKKFQLVCKMLLISGVIAFCFTACSKAEGSTVDKNGRDETVGQAGSNETIPDSGREAYTAEEYQKVMDEFNDLSDQLVANKILTEDEVNQTKQFMEGDLKAIKEGKTIVYKPLNEVALGNGDFGSVNMEEDSGAYEIEKETNLENENIPLEELKKMLKENKISQETYDKIVELQGLIK